MSYHKRCIRVVGFLVTEMDFESAKLRKSETEKRDPKKYFIFGRDPRLKHASRIPRPKVGVNLVV